MVLPAAVWVVQPSRRSMVLFFAALALVVIWMHRSNIRRLLNGTEHRFRTRRALANRSQ
jgi:glycerol-3-phosphate acyltransferase PlsY